MKKYLKQQKGRLLLALIFIFAGVTVSDSHKLSAQGRGKLPVDHHVKKGKLKNGLTYFVRANGQPQNQAELRLVVNVGSLQEDDDQRGVAHFVEHMAFNGTRNFEKNEIINYLERIGSRMGADLNASTSFAETTYILRIPTDMPGAIDKAFLIIADWMQHISFEDDEIEKERGVVIEEWRAGQGAGSRMQKKQLPILLHNSRYAERLPIGTKESLETFTADAVRRFYEDWYRPELMAIIAVGDFDREEIENKIKKQFSGIPSRKKKRKHRYFPVPNHSKPLIAIASDREATRSRISVYYKNKPVGQGTHKTYRAKLLSYLYLGMLNDRFGEMLLKPDAPFLVASSQRSNLVRTKSAFTMSALVKDNGFVEGLEALLLEAERIADYGFTQSELDRQKAQLLRGMERIYNEREKANSYNFAEEYIRSFLTGEGIPGVVYEWKLFKKYIPEIKLKDVNRVGRKWITKKNRVVLVNAPEKEGLSLPTEEELLAVFSKIKSQKIQAFTDNVATEPLLDEEPAGGTVIKEKYEEKIKVTRLTLENGATVILRPSTFKSDEILFTAFSPGGNSIVPDTDFIPTATADAVVTNGGLRDFDAIQLSKLLAGRVARVRPYIGLYDEGLTGNSTVQDIETMFQLIYLYFTAPRKDEKAFQAYQSRLRGFVENREASPETAFNDTIKVTMAQNHFRARPVSKSLVEEMDLDRSFDFYKDRFADVSDFTFVFTGAFTKEKLTPFIERYLGSLKSINRKESARDTGMRPPKGRIVKHVYRGEEPKATTRIIITGEFEWSTQNRFDLQAMASVLDFRLRERLREELGGTYGVNVSASARRIPYVGYEIHISFGSDPERVEELVAEIQQVMEQFSKYGPEMEEMAKLTEIKNREHEMAMLSNRSWLNWLKFYERHGENANQILAFESLVEEMTNRSVQKAAQKYLRMDNWVQISLLPAQQ